MLFHMITSSNILDYKGGHFEKMHQMGLFVTYSSSAWFKT